MILFIYFFTWTLAQKLTLKHVIHQQSHQFQYQRHFLEFSDSLNNEGTVIAIQNNQPMSNIQLLPDIQDPDTILSLAMMSYDAYEGPEPVNYSPKWNQSKGVGWEKDGVRGYIYTDEQESIVTVAFKGTSTSFYGIGGGPTSAKDKFNDNVMFSCCCAKEDVTWRPVCPCCDGHLSCNSTCLSQYSNFNDSYFNMAMEISKFTEQLYPHAQIWYSGHSLGGALASLVAIATQRPAITFEAPGEFMYAQRIGLIPSFNTVEERKLHLESLPIFHFGNDLDPIFLGRCNGPLSSCYFAGYAMETQCHSGKSCVYSSENSKSMDQFRRQYDTHPDIESKLMNINYHRLTYLLNQYLIPKVSVPACQVETQCQDCPVWKFHI